MRRSKPVLQNRLHFSYCITNQGACKYSIYLGPAIEYRYHHPSANSQNTVRKNCGSRTVGCHLHLTSRIYILILQLNISKPTLFLIILLLYALIGGGLLLLFSRLSPAAEPNEPPPTGSRFGLTRSRGIVLRLSALFAVPVAWAVARTDMPGFHDPRPAARGHDEPVMRCHKTVRPLGQHPGQLAGVFVVA